MGSNIATNYITCPGDPKKTLGIKLPFLVMIIELEEVLLLRGQGVGRQEHSSPLP